MSQEPDKEPSGTEPHWDHIGTNILAIATAALAAVFYILVRADPDPTHTGAREIITVTAAGAAVGIYAAIIVLVGRAIFGRRDLVRTKRETWKRNRIHEAFCTFGTILAPLAIMVAVNFIVPTFAAWYQQNLQEAVTGEDQPPEDMETTTTEEMKPGD